MPTASAQAAFRAPARGRARRQRRAADWTRSALLLAPSLVVLLAFTYWPLAQAAWRSLNVESFGGADAIGLGNYARLFADPHFARAASNNALYAVFTIVPSLAIALGLATALQAGTGWAALVRAVFVLPTMIPLVAAAALFSFIFLPGGGLLDAGLARLGLRGANWLGDPALALPSVIAITIWKNVGYYMLFFLAGLAGIAPELAQAARLDGAGSWAVFRHVTLPQLGPTFGFLLPIALLNAITQVDQVVTLTQGGPTDATNLLLFYIYQLAEQNGEPALASAATIVSVAALMALSLLSLRTLERGIHYES